MFVELDCAGSGPDQAWPTQLGPPKDRSSGMRIIFAMLMTQGHVTLRILRVFIGHRLQGV